MKSALGPRQCAVCDVANQDVTEGQLVARPGPKELALNQALGRIWDLVSEARFERRDPRRRKSSTEYRAELQRAPGDRVQGVQARENGGLDRVRQARSGSRKRVRIVEIHSTFRTPTRYVVRDGPAEEPLSCAPPAML